MRHIFNNIQSRLDKCDDHDVDQAGEVILQRNELYGYVAYLQVYLKFSFH